MTREEGPDVACRTTESLDTSLSQLITATGVRIPFCMDDLQERMATLLGVPIVAQRIPTATSFGTGAVFYDPAESIYKILIQGATTKWHQDNIHGHELTHIWRGHLHDPATATTRFVCDRARLSPPADCSRSEKKRLSRLNEMETEADAGGLVLSSWSKHSRSRHFQISEDPTLADLTYTLMGSPWR